MNIPRVAQRFCSAPRVFARITMMLGILSLRQICLAAEVDVLAQSGAGLPAIWGTNQGQPIPAHYTFSTNLLAANRRELLDGLSAIPSLFIATDPQNLFSPKTGIYLHPTERGKNWERAATVRLLDPDGHTNFQIKCGLRIHGGMSRRPEESPKHSFRLSFRREYGPDKLRARLFGPDGPQEFDDLVLRAGGNDSWLSSDSSQRNHATYIRDEWMRRSMEALGHRSVRGIFVHLFLNGLYWGIYNVCERPGAQMLDANPKNVECDILKGDETQSGDRAVWDKMLALADSGLSNERRFEEVTRHLDVPQFMDFMLLNLYAGNSDWDRSANWIAIRPRTSDGRFQFFIWDAEQVLNDSGFNPLKTEDEGSPVALFKKLSENSGFRATFATRAESLLSTNAPLSPEAAAKRFQSLADSIANAVPLEAARWGGYRRDVHPYKTGPYELHTAEKDWQPEVNRIAARYFSQRREELYDQLRERGFPCR